MGLPLAETNPGGIDLTAPPPLREAAQRLTRVPVSSDFLRAVETLGREEHLGRRVQRLCDLFRNLDTDESAAFLLAATRLALREETAGIRVLSSALDVKRPGVEVLRRLQALSCLERTSLRLLHGTWKEPEDAEEENPAFAIIDLFRDAAAAGVIDIGVELLPGRVDAVQALLEHFRRWFAVQAVRLAQHEKVPDEQVRFLVQLCMLEIALTERRISRLAESIDPYDSRGMGRLMPVLSRYDQDIEHMKNVVSRLTTYQPFHDRMLTLEHAITEHEMDKLLKVLDRHAVGSPVGRLFRDLRGNPILDRQFLFLVSAVHQTATLRSLHVPEAEMPDLLSSLHQVVTAYREGEPLHLALEPEAVDAAWSVMRTWGVAERTPGGLLLTYREDRALDFIRPDGTPHLPYPPEALESPETSLEELVRANMQNDAFLLGILDNPQALNRPRLIPLIATHCRSLRVLGKIASTRRLYSGAANKDVPRLLLLNPARIPIATLRPFIHVRFVSKNDLRRMSLPHSDVRPEVQQEIRSYLRALSP